ncbi:TetR family transcriptional regulator [Streptomyces ipomoeae]|jgi:AcrR family transcriptional regulator|uniref:TetR/AcrR family transcriptional regulator n=1 Tax=Streptomyces ipomoeae TaxID=103232 RepID=UPI0029BE79AA|nr:TetR family transcriptional regulator [Streptomyces ipomoeae]MDX2822972.1 TetR family transcriptional regulator [Streptomyces ipomoeae]MDX2873938.1 TetR family transcriptional regulator [Streptomyces ipomoeae]
METAAEATPQERQGLRERKKQRTRDALMRAALELFTTQGYEGTTVDEIAEAVDVSQRTFFRYFAGKEEAALAVLDIAQERFLAAVRARPAHEPPLEALRNAVLDGWDSISDAVQQAVPVDLYLRSYRMIESTLALLAAHLRRSDEVAEEMARIIAEREGLDVDADPRPRVAVALFAGVIRVTEHQWATRGNLSLDTMHELTRSYLDAIRPSLTEKWRTD